MSVKTRTATVHNHFIEIDGQEYETSLLANEYIDPKVEVEDTKTTITYAADDIYPSSPREWGTAGTMVVTGNKRNYSIDDAENDLAALAEAADELEHTTGKAEYEIYYAKKCSCWSSLHELEEVEDGTCPEPFDMLIVATEDGTFPDGSTFGYEFPLDGSGDLESAEGTAAMLLAASEGTGWTTAFDLMKAYVEAGRPDITAFIEWSVTGYSQGDWVDGYAYMTAEDFTDPEAALKGEVEEYAAFFRGDVYLAVRETYYEDINGEHVSHDYDCIGGYYGDESIKSAINGEETF